MPLTLKGSSSGGVTIDVPATAGNNTLTFPAATGTALVGTTTTANQVFFGGATSGTLSQDSNLVWDNTNKRLGIGTATPSTPITVSLNTTSPPTALGGTMAHIVGADGVAPRVSVEAFAQGGQLAFRRANGTNASPSALVVNELLGTIAVFGYGATGYSGSNRGYIGFSAAENWTDSAQGTYLTFSTTATGAASASEKMRIASDGSVGIGTNNPTVLLDVSKTTSGGVTYARIQNSDTGASSGAQFNVQQGAVTCFMQAYGNSGAYVGTITNHSFNISTNSSPRLTVDTSGNLGLGVTPSAWGSGWKAVEVGRSGSSLYVNTSNGNTIISSNFYVDSTNTSRYSNNGFAAGQAIRSSDGAIVWNIAPSGTAGNSITFTQAMTLTAAGELLVGRTGASGLGKFNVEGGADFTGGNVLLCRDTGNVGIGIASPSYKLSVNGVGNFYSGVAGLGRVFLGDPADNSGYIGLYRSALGPSNYITAGNGLNFASIDGYTFNTGPASYGTQTERMRIDSNGNVGIGTSSPGARLEIGNPSDANQMMRFRFPDSSTAELLTSRLSTGNLQALRLQGQDGIQFYTNGSERARITFGGDVYFGQSTGATPPTTGADVICGGLIINPSRRTTAATTPVCVWDSTNGVFNRSTSSLKYKRDVQDATYGLSDVLNLRPVTFKGKSESDGDRIFGGLIAEEVDAAGLTMFVDYAEDGTPDGLGYSAMVSLAFKAIQELAAEVAELKAKVA